jgi:hypothetical protein
LPKNVVPSCTWLYKMHHTHQPYKQIWAHPLPNGNQGKGNHICNQKKTKKQKNKN